MRDAIIQAFGIDISNTASKIYWEQYIKLKCFLHFFTLQKAELISFWVKILDPHGIRHMQRRCTMHTQHRSLSGIEGPVVSVAVL